LNNEANSLMQLVLGVRVWVKTGMQQQ
jgi:hypothetical protein